MSSDFLEDKTEKESDKIVCESCGKEFFCGADAGECWCFTVQVKAETLGKLRENFDRCLCADCLEKAVVH